MNYRIEQVGVGFPALVAEDGRRWCLAAHGAWQGSIAVCSRELLDLCNRDVEARIAVEEYVSSYWPQLIDRWVNLLNASITKAGTTNRVIFIGNWAAGEES